MRIIGGKFKGLRINPPGKLPVRPTTDRSKEALFNVLEYKLNLSGAEALDLFAGTGSVSFELASRGVHGVRAVDGGHDALRAARALGLLTGAEHLLRERSAISAH